MTQPSPDQLAARRRFWEVQAQSVRRQFEDGLTASLIARRSGTSVEIVRRYLRLAYADVDEA